jgi:hypothetical protein
MPEACPCQLDCHDRKSKAVNIVFKKKVITSTELLKVLTDVERLGKEAARKNLNFLHHIDEKRKVNQYGCRYIAVAVEPAKHPLFPEAMLFFRGKTRVFYSKDANKEEIDAVVERLLSHVQKDILYILREKKLGSYYLSSYEVRKLLPEKGDRVSLGLNKLIKIGFVKKHKIRSEVLRKALATRRKYLDFYTTTQDATLFESKFKVDAPKYEIAENLVLRGVQRIFMHSNGSLFHVKSFKNTIRTKAKRLLGQVNGMSYDILVPLEDSYQGKRFLAVDV